MALPSSGQISFNDVRTETSQGSMTKYSFNGWASGMNRVKGANDQWYAPINILSSGSRFSGTSRLQCSNLSMSAWYSYDHSPSISTNVTGVLYSHANPYSFSRSFNETRGDNIFEGVKTMLPINLGTSNATYSINLSGSVSSSTSESILFYYGKFWAADGLSLPGNAITGAYAVNGVFSFNYNYTYNASSGSILYAVITSNPA